MTKCAAAFASLRAHVRCDRPLLTFDHAGGPRCSRQCLMHDFSIYHGENRAYRRYFFDLDGQIVSVEDGEVRRIAYVQPPASVFVESEPSASLSVDAQRL